MATATRDGFRWFRGHERIGRVGKNDLTGHLSAGGGSLTGQTAEGAGEGVASVAGPLVREWRVILCHAASGQEWSFVVESGSAAGAVSVVRLAVPDGRWLLESVWDDSDVRVV